MSALNEGFMRRAQRVRHTLKRKAHGRARLSVFRSSKHIYAQVIDDNAGRTVVAASTLDKDLKGSLKKGFTNVVFDRGGYLYHGRVKALADAAREAGLNF